MPQIESQRFSIHFLFNPLLAIGDSSRNVDETLEYKEGKPSDNYTRSLVTDVEHTGDDTTNAIAKSDNRITKLAKEAVVDKLPLQQHSSEETSAADIDAGGAPMEIELLSRRRIFADYWFQSADAVVNSSRPQFPISLTVRNVLLTDTGNSVSFTEVASTQPLAQDEKVISYPSLETEFHNNNIQTMPCQDLQIEDQRSNASSGVTLYIDSDVAQKMDIVRPLPRANTTNNSCHQLANYSRLPPLHRSSSLDRIQMSPITPEYKTNLRRKIVPVSSFTTMPLLLSSTVNQRASTSSLTSSSLMSDQSSEGGSCSANPISILRKPRCHIRLSSDGSKEENQPSWEGGPSRTMKSGEGSNSGATNTKGVRRRNSLKEYKHRPTSPAPKPGPHVSIFKRPESIRLPWKIGNSLLPSWLTTPSAVNKDVMGTSFDSSGEVRLPSSFRWDHLWGEAHVHFDPRVGVVEYMEDDEPFQSLSQTEGGSSKVGGHLKHKRLSDERNEASSSKWFSAEELNEFKLDALQQCQLVLLSAPRSRLKCHLVSTNQVQTQRRSKPNTAATVRTGNGVNAMVGKMNALSPQHSPIPRKSSFANPILQYTPEDNIIMEGSEELATLLRSNIRSVLIVDPKENLRNLFQKAIQYLFPETKVLTTASAEGASNLIEAAKLINSASNDQDKDGCCLISYIGFDIIIMEERLQPKSMKRNSVDDDDDDRALRRSQSEEDASSSSMQQPAGEEQLQRRSCAKLPMSGSELLNTITKEEKKWMHLRSLRGDECRMDIFRPSLYIGVSFFLADDGPKLLQSGADLIWGKPPPKIDHYLRNSLVTSLLKKRGKSVLICSQ